MFDAEKIVKHGTPFELFQEHSSISSLRATEKIKNKINVIIKLLITTSINLNFI